MKRATICLCCLAALALALLVANCAGSSCGTPQANKGKLSGAVYYYASQTPYYVSGATVHIVGTLTFNTSTNASGRYCRNDINPSTYQIWAENAARSSSIATLVVNADASIDRDFNLSIAKATPAAGAPDLHQGPPVASRLQDMPLPSGQQ